MLDKWTISRKVVFGFACIALLTVGGSAAAISSLRYVTASKDDVITVNAARRLQVEEMRVVREKRAKAVRSYLITKQERYIGQVAEYRDEIVQQGAALRGTAIDPEERALIEDVIATNAKMQAAWDAMVAARKSGVPMEAMTERFEQNQSIVKALDVAMTALADWEDAALAQRSEKATEDATFVMWTLGILALFHALLAAVLSVLLGRNIVRHVGTAVHNVQNSSTELQSSAAQQASSSQELASTTSEISTTIRELLATSRQITESAQRVVQVAHETGSVAKSGDVTGQRASDAVKTIRDQVDVIVSHMLELGRRAQQIGAILDLINELAEQTNILSINATIEAAGAGESGRRFAVVADEIRRLADRVGGSAREIRTLIEEIRSSANTTVMATEDGRKAVDAGTRQFAEVITAFAEISQRVGVTADAAREIELSIRQQTTAVEQVNLAVAGMAQAAKETEASAGQTLETAGQLASVSTQLGRLIWAKVA